MTLITRRNKTKGRVSKRVFQGNKARQIFRTFSYRTPPVAASQF